MDESQLQELRERADALEPAKEALEAYEVIFEVDPLDRAAANMVGRSLEELGHLEQAAEHWELVAEFQPENKIAQRRAQALEHRRRRLANPPSGSGHPMTDPGEIKAYYLQTTDRMRAFLDELARHPGLARTNPQIESALGWGQYSVRGTASGSTRRLGADAFEGRIPYHTRAAGMSSSGRFETWMDQGQADAIRSLQE